ncbi:TetR/AcrR family transcriptional regulator [Amycolatopsis sp. NPDC059021]|uniref:TetR/AcrR family transcriptional regulator n=1 Tax=Amycolatopsis sp. NPDC059021 TaxID=3346704 RepID=UPI00366CE7CA
MTADATPSASSAEGRPAADQARTERADAARNRAKILTTAEELVAEYGVTALSMNSVAAAAGVGVGTVYRRFTDHAGLVEALMDHRETQLQEDMRSGPPPLGPGAPPIERIKAFLHAYVDVLEFYAPLMAEAERTMARARRYRSGPYAVHHRHLADLITEAAPKADAHYLADALLAPLAAGLFTYQRHEEGLELHRIRAGLDALVEGIGTLR